MMHLYRYTSILLIALFLTACGSPQPAEAATKAMSISFLLAQVRTTSGPLAGGKVDFYAAGTTTRKTIWLDRNKATPAANPYTLDSNGTAQLYGDGLYRIVIKNAAGSTVYDRDNQSIRDASGLAYDVADYTSLAAAVAAIGSAPATLEYSTHQFISDNLVIPTNIKLQPINGAIIYISAVKTLTITPGATDHVTPGMFGAITYGTTATSGQQSANTAAFNVAVSIAAASNIPCKPGPGTILVNDDIVSAMPVSIIGDAATPTRVLQTTAGKYVFYLGNPTYPNFTYGYRLANLTLASAAGSAGNVYLGNIIGSTFENVTMPGAGLYGWTIDDCQDLHFRNCTNSGYFRPLIAGQNQTGSSNGVWGNGSTTGAAWRITGTTTTVHMDGCDIAVARAGIINDSPSLQLIWNGTVQGMVGYALEDRGALNGFSLDLYLDGFGDTPGGVLLTGSAHGKIHLRNTDLNGVKMIGVSNIEVSGTVNRVDIDAASRGVLVKNATYNQVTGGGYIKDLAPDSRFVDVANSAQSDVYYGVKGAGPMVSIHPSTAFERWMGTTRPCGWTAYGGAALSKETTTVFSGSASAKVIGHASASAHGMATFLHPISMFTGKMVTVKGRVNAASDSTVTFFLNAGAVVKSADIKANGSTWTPFAVSCYLAPGTTGAVIILQPGASATVYYDDVEVLAESYSPALPAILDTTTTPSVTALGAGYAPLYFWKFANVSPTSVTTFTDGFGGQKYTVILDANTTLVDGATLQLRGGTNKAGAGMVLELMYDSDANVWYQTGYESAN